MRYKLEIEIKESPLKPRCQMCDLCIYDPSEIYCAATSEMARANYDSELSLELACHVLLEKCPLEVVG